MKRSTAIVRTWLVWLVICVAAAAYCFAHVDVRLAVFCWKLGRFLHPLNRPFQASVLLSLETAVMLTLMMVRVIHGHLSRFAETLVIACLASICAYGINSLVLKPFFGVSNPVAVVHGARHALYLFKGSPMSSFPSGHMVLAGAFAGAFMRLYRRSIWPLAVLLAIAAALLVFGDWHFLSDAIAGTFLGVTAGMLAGESWSVHDIRGGDPVAPQ